MATIIWDKVINSTPTLYIHVSCMMCIPICLCLIFHLVLQYTSCNMYMFVYMYMSITYSFKTAIHTYLSMPHNYIIVYIICSYKYNNIHMT